MKLRNRFTFATATLLSAWLAQPVAASAQTTVYHFGDLLSGDGAPVQLDFATLSATVSGNDVLFTLDAQNLDLFDGKQPFIGALTIDGDRVGGVGGVSGDSPVKMVNGGGPNGGWEFRFDLTGKKKDRLVDDESVSWTWIGGAGHFTNIGAHVQGLDYGGTTSAWYQTLAVPEPGAYAMFLSGLAVLGVSALRRRRPGS
ncbi:MAG TPA: PEP-CTERM sorting domain-containing protein [Ideonella sp.]|uniref:PEP-CTERM sorting domain-containing protein n=1 Tax=Ideonella sp. TaxID=1929293 RepID=UPI002E3660B0|nr:PEP-CTERM sorting domain-containing protein [Ideonella sp.]HEX5688158.1 PEP-CTERM sorting domain-containing protein [Ideonella sp.]